MESAPKGVERGKELFPSCTPCHGESGQGRPEISAPNIAGLNVAYVYQQLVNFKSGHRGVHFDDIEGQRMQPMARHLKNDRDIESVAEYVASLPRVKPPARFKEMGIKADAEKGKPFFASCSACHGMKGEGNIALKAPSLNKSSDWYLLKQLKKFDKKIRGYSEADTGGTIMLNSVKVLNSDEQTMRNLVAYIMTLSK